MPPHNIQRLLVNEAVRVYLLALGGAASLGGLRPYLKNVHRHLGGNTTTMRNTDIFYIDGGPRLRGRGPWLSESYSCVPTRRARALQRQRSAGLAFVEPKTAKSRRTVHLAEGTVVALREHRHRQAEERLAAGPAWHDNGLTFCREDGRPLEPSGVAQGFRAILDKAGLPGLRVHDLRHTAATLLLTKGVHPQIVQELLGHSTVSLTLDTYSHVVPPLHGEVAVRMDTFFEQR